MKGKNAIYLVNAVFSILESIKGEVRLNLYGIFKPGNEKFRCWFGRLSLTLFKRKTSGLIKK